jgi:hypothetical protein
LARRSHTDRKNSIHLQKFETYVAFNP